MSEEHHETQEDTQPKKAQHSGNFRTRLNSFNAFLTYFYQEQKQTPWQFLIGPGPSKQHNYTLTHSWYIFILSFIPVCSLLTGLGFLQPYLASDSSLCDWKHRKQSCESLVVLFVTYRIGFAITIFFLFNTIILTKTSKRLSNDSNRASNDSYNTPSNLHTGFWIEKIIIVLVLSCVAFAFPPSIFDSVWLYVVLCGDVIFSCVQVFLICDVVKDMHTWLQSLIKKDKVKNNQLFKQSILLFFEILIPVSLITVGMSLTIYTSITSVKCTIVIVLTIVSTVIILCVLGYVFFARRKKILLSLYVFSYVMFLLYKWISFRVDQCSTEYNGLVDNIIPPDGKTLLSIFILYATIIYALVRKDKISHFFYFHWVLSRGNVLIDRTNEPIANKNKDQKINRKHEHNPNETLLDLTVDGINACTEKNANEAKEWKNTDLKLEKYINISYSESFIHGVLLLVSLKSTSTVTNYHLLQQTNENLVFVNPLISSIILYVSHVIVILTYCWTLYVAHWQKKFNYLSVGMLLETFVKYISKVMNFIFIKPPTCLTNTNSRYVYVVIYVTSVVLSSVAISQPFRHLTKTSIFCPHVVSFGACMTQDPFYILLFRLLATFSLFFCILCLLLLNVNTTDSPRGVIQHGCWLLKVIALIVLFLVVTHLPIKLNHIWLYISLTSTFLFTFIQFFCLLDAVGILNLSWNQTRRISKNTAYYGSSSLITFLYVISTAAFVCFYVYYAHNFQCKVPRLFISINLILCISSSLISIHPVVISGGLLRSAVVTSFCMYLTWSALNYNPNEKCNPLAHTLIMIESNPSRDFVSISDISLLVLTIIYFTYRVQHILELLIKLFPLFLCHCTADKKSDVTMDTSHDVITTLNNDYQEFDAKGIEQWLAACKSDASSEHEHAHVQPPYFQEQTLRERLLFGYNIDQIISHTYSSKRLNVSTMLHISVPYNYSWLHFMYFLATSYTFILMTHWLESIPGSNFKITVHWSIMSVKMVASSTCVLLYIWSLVIPVVENTYFYRNK